MDLDAELEELAAQQLEEDLMKMDMPAQPSAPVAGKVPPSAAKPAEAAPAPVGGSSSLTSRAYGDGSSSV